MAKIDQTVEALRDKLRKAEEKQRARDARVRTAEARAKRAGDARRKILVGAAFLAKVERGQFPRDEFNATMDSFLTRPVDRELFGFKPK